MGKYLATLEPGLRLLIPVLDKVRYVQSLKGERPCCIVVETNWEEVALEIPSQSAITADNVTLDIDGVLYIRVFDPYKARWGLCA
jgi:regulator of protease activity HflC (stomatin/prohibitin superfamily)